MRNYCRCDEVNCDTCGAREWSVSVDTMWGAAVSNPPHYHYIQGPSGPVPQAGPSGPVLNGPNARHLRPQSSYSLPHGSNGPGRWGWSGSHVSSFDRRQMKVPPQPVRPAPNRPSHSRNVGTNVSEHNDLGLISDNSENGSYFHRPLTIANILVVVWSLGSCSGIKCVCEPLGCFV